ncbi:MAG: hypothetical protein JRG80_10610 [Deltaproteobacteria bacterium]|nr:hypothetical protein [Deltaproteobacteria bacterium]MBW2399713.1 hypothetical protein [Deltaproteobacteria bacterium]
MELVVMLGGGPFFVMGLVVGGRLLLLAYRHRALPELLLGAAFLVGPLSGALSQYIHAPGFPHSVQTRGLMLLVNYLGGMAGVILSASFVRLVFRPGRAWALALTLAIAAGGVGLILWTWSIGTFTTGNEVAVQRAILSSVSLPATLWAAIEALSHYRMLRRRIRLGLGDPLVANRLLLWGVGACCGTGILIGYLPVIMLPAEHLWTQLGLLNIGVLGAVATVTYGFAFFPPRGYADWVRRRAASAARPSATRTAWAETS